MSSIIDRIVPKQRKMSIKTGGLLIIVEKNIFLFSLLNFLMITRLRYYSSGDSYFLIIYSSCLIYSIVAFLRMWIIYSQRTSTSVFM